MGVVSRAVDRLPKWAQIVLGALSVVASVYYVNRYGLLRFLVALLKPVP